MIYIGASGYSYPDWKGAFYPEKIRDNDMLGFYASRFPAVEINYTYYRMPSARTMAAMLRKTWKGFLFAVKAPGEITHELKLDDDMARRFIEALTPLMDADALAALLFQFPYSFKNSEDNREYVAGIRKAFPGLPVVIEFRHSSWCDQKVNEFLSAYSLAMAAVDAPQLQGLMPPSYSVTSEPGYVRFHGRNKEHWWRHKEAWERYNYLYSREELGEWVPRLINMAERCDRLFVMMNNHFGGRAPKAADLLLKLLIEEGAEVAIPPTPSEPDFETLSLFD